MAAHTAGQTGSVPDKHWFLWLPSQMWLRVLLGPARGLTFKAWFLRPTSARQALVYKRTTVSRAEVPARELALNMKICGRILQIETIMPLIN